MDTSTPAPMVVDSPPPPETRDFYSPPAHDAMDLEVQTKLEANGLQWRENPPLGNLRHVLRAVTQSDPKLDRKYLDLDIPFPQNASEILSEAWKAKEFKRVRIHCALQAEIEAPMVADSPPPPETRDFYSPPAHDAMDLEVRAKLEADELQWRENPPLGDLRHVLRAVAQSDPKLDRKYLGFDTPFPQNEREILSEAWKAREFKRVRIRCALQAPKIEENLTEVDLAALAEAMTRDYQGTYVDTFAQYLHFNQFAFNSAGKTYYAKFCSITQSSGTGKTRLLFELGRKVLVLYINIRSEIDTGYPPRDMIPAKILTEVFPTKESYSRRCRIFFATVFKCLADFLKKSSHPFGVLSNVGDERRTQFFENFGNEFNKLDRESSSYNVMCKYYGELEKRLQQENENVPKVVIALDEAHVLHEKTKDYLPVVVLLQTIKEYSDKYKKGPVWVVFASTAKVAHYVPLHGLFPSAGVAVGGESLFPPFTQLGWDQYAPVLNEVELDKVAWGSHLLQYGRPLWWSLKGHRSLPNIIDLATQKLCASRTFNPMDEHQAFAVLGQRFGLDIAFGGHRDAVQFNDTLMTHHLRICIKTTDDGIWRYTTYPSEPIVSVAAAELLYEKEENLSNALQEVCGMVKDGLINTGDSGELANRFLWLLAKDCSVHKGLGRPSCPPSIIDGVIEDEEFLYCQAVPVVEFLELAFGPHILDKAPNAREKFQGAFINFSHWIQMRSDITRVEGGKHDVSIEEWTESLWARTSAVQCCLNQPVTDKVIPIYFESRPRECAFSHILISDRARDSTQQDLLDKITRQHESIAPHYKGPPYIAILVDLGLSPSTVDVLDKTTEGDPCLRIYAAALDKETFPFLEEGIVQSLRCLYELQFVPSGRAFLEEAENEVQFGASREAPYMNLKN